MPVLSALAAFLRRPFHRLATIWTLGAVILVGMTLSAPAQTVQHPLRVSHAGPPRVILTEPGAATSVAGPLVVFYSGDGGWAHTDRALAKRLGAGGLRVAGIDALHYFWSPRTPDSAAADLADVIDRYGQGRDGVVLMGYSFGASALPLITPRLPPAVLSQVRLMVLIAPMDRGELVMRPQSWFDIPDRTSRPVAPLLRGLAGMPVLCVYGASDRHAACPRLGRPVSELRLAGGHHLTGQEDAIVGAAFTALAARPRVMVRDALLQAAN